MQRLHSRLMAVLLAAGGLAGVGISDPAIAQPSLSHVLPGAVAPGKTTEITLHGSKLLRTPRIWTSFAAQVEVAAAPSSKEDQGPLVCKVTLPAGAPLGIGGIAVATAEGVSDVVYVMIDDMSSITDHGENHTPQEISLPAAIDGQCDGTLSDYYRFYAKRGERISCEVVAARLGWDVDPLIRVLDGDGKEVLLADDDPSAGADPRFVFNPPADGQYVLELRDNRYKGGGRYRLRLGDFPLISTPVPLLIQRGTTTRLGFCGPRVEGLGLVSVLTPTLADCCTEVALTVRDPAQQSAGWTTLPVTDLPVFVESMKDDSSANVGPASLPCAFAGTLEAPGERDLYHFQAKKNARVNFRAITRSAGSPAVVSLQLLKTSRSSGTVGSQLAESTVTDSDEPVLAFTIPDDGEYVLAVEELAGRGGPDYTYAVEARTGPQLSLTLKNDKSNRLLHAVPAGGGLSLDVQCERTNYDGPVTLFVDSPRPGWQLSNHVIAAKATEVKLKVEAPADFSAGELATLRIVGRGDIEGQGVQAVMTTTAQLRAARPLTPYPPAWHDGTIFICGLAPPSK